MSDQKIQMLLAYANEHYAHARDHEHLRSQVTAILSAASMVLVGLGLEKLDASSPQIAVIGLIVIGLGALNLRLNFLHKNRFDAHVAAARASMEALEGGAECIKNSRKAFDAVKRGGLSKTWNMLPVAMILLGLAMTLFGVSPIVIART